jgi:hypothetical protein
LNKSLYRLKIVDTTECQCSEGEELIEHILLYCLTWAAIRAKL